MKRSLLCPQLLRDSETMAAYVGAFPRDSYRLKRVPGAGRFFLDGKDDVIKNVLRRGEIWEAHLRAILKRHVQRGTTVVDAGAHIGTHSIYLSRLVGRRGRVFAFEPQRKIFRELVHNLKANRARSVVPLRFALGRKHAIIEMNPAPRGNEGHTSVGSGGDRAELRTLDSFRFANVSLLKIDVEGFENNVIEGARQLIAQHRPVILVELQGGFALESAPLATKRRIWASIAKLEGLGYAVRRVGVHDYLATHAASSAMDPRLGFSQVLKAASPRVHTVVGQRREGEIQSMGKAGRLSFGPYDFLPAGSYVVRFYGRGEGSAAMEFDVVSGKGRRLHARRRGTCVLTKAVKNLAVLSFTLEKEALDVEYRTRVSQRTKVGLVRVLIQRIVTD